MATVRRSGRTRKANPKYTNDLLDEEAKKILAPVSGSSSASEQGEAPAEDESTGSEFDAEQVIGDYAQSDEDELSIGSAGAGGLSEGSGIETPAESDDEIISIASDYDSDGQPVKTRRIGVVKQGGGKETHSRGLGARHSHGAKEVGWGILYGPSQEDLLPAIYVRDMWLKPDDITLPSRRTLTKVISDGEYGKTNRYGISEERLRLEATGGWDWYYNDKGLGFRSSQQTSNVEDESIRKQYHRRGRQFQHSVVLGPSQRQTRFTIAEGDCIDIGTAWQSRSPQPSSDAMDVDQPAHASSEQTPIGGNTTSARSDMKRVRNGWLFTTGHKVQTLAWAPNTRDSRQYLAVSCATTSSQRKDFPPHASAMTAAPPYPSNIQIWSIESCPEPGQPSRLDMKAKPRLRQVICTDWGDIRHLAWCPVLRQERVSDSEHTPAGYIGILAVVSSDGSVRVLDVSANAESTEYVHLDSAAFTASPPSQSPIYTAVNFLSSTDLAVSDSTGSIHLFSLTNQAFKQKDNIAIPYYTTPLPPASTFILRMSPCYPSTIPGILAFASAGGETSLLSMAQPHVEVVSAGRSRIATSDLSYMPQLRGHVVSQDDGLYFHPIRRFFSAVTLGRADSSGSITCHDTSRWHPCVIVGTTGGEVFATNALRRVLPMGKLFGRSGHWQQRILKYDWIPDKGSHLDGIEAEHVADSDQTDKFHVPDVRPGMSRFHDGFRPDRPELGKGSGRLSGQGKKKGVTSEPGLETIFEEENAVTAVQWNPNLTCAGWAAIGFGSGLIRIEDYAWE